MIPNLLQRMVWNTSNWQRPSGSASEGGYPAKNGFGHEEWNFQLSDTWNGYVFPFMRETPAIGNLEDSEGLFNIGFYARHPEHGKCFLIGIHHNAELIEDTEYPEILKSFRERGILKRRAVELHEVTKKFSTQDDAMQMVLYSFQEPLFKVKSPVSDIEWFSRPIEFPRPKSNRFTFSYDDSFLNVASSRGNTEHQKSALTEDGYYRETSQALKFVIQEHNKLSNSFSKWLRDKGIAAEQENAYIDVQFENKGVSYIAELKVVYGVGTTKAIREAMGQLLEYNFYPGRKSRKKWMIILDQMPTESDKDYIDILNEEIDIWLRIGWQTDSGFDFYPQWRI